MEVVLDCERMQYPYTGLFEYCHQLGLALIATKQPTDVLDIYTQKVNEQHFPEHQHFLTSTRLHKFIFPRLSTNIELWHATHQLSKYLPPSNRKIKRVLTIHDLNFLYEKTSAKKHASYLRKIQRNIDRCDHIIAISEFTRQDILKNLKVRKPITVIYNGVNFDAFPDFHEPRYRPAKPFLFAIGTVNAKKNFHVLPALLEDNDFELLIAGTRNEAYEQRIFIEAAKYGALERVKVLGPVSAEEKYWYFKNCDAFALPSIAEGFGIPVIEAMRFGKPVFLSTKTSLPEIGGKYACYFESFDPAEMQKTFENGMKTFGKETTVEEIKKYAQQFNWERTAKAYWEVYRSLV